MSAAETVYSVRVAYPDYLERARAQTVSLPIWRDGALAAPSSGTFTLRRPNGDTLVTGAVVVAGSIATYPVLAASIPATENLGHGYQELWELTLADGTTQTIPRDAALVKHAARPTLTDDDITAVYSDLARHMATGDTTFQPKIDEAWKQILGRLEMQGVFPDHIVTYWSVREVHLQLALYLTLLDFSSRQGDRWAEMAEAHKREFEMAWARLRFRKSTTDTGLQDGDGMKSAGEGVTHINASPRRSWRGNWGL